MEAFYKLGNQLFQINNKNNTLEVSTDGGKNWHYRQSMNSITSITGNIHDMLVYQNELLILGDRGLHYSTDGVYWQWRQGYQSITSVTGSIRSLTANGDELLIVGSNGLYYSKDGGKLWQWRSR